MKASRTTPVLKRQKTRQNAHRSRIQDGVRFSLQKAASVSGSTNWPRMRTCAPRAPTLPLAPLRPRDICRCTTPPLAPRVPVPYPPLCAPSLTERTHAGFVCCCLCRCISNFPIYLFFFGKNKALSKAFLREERCVIILVYKKYFFKSKNSLDRCVIDDLWQTLEFCNYLYGCKTILLMAVVCEVSASERYFLQARLLLQAFVVRDFQ